jgi:hypothetical protein
VRGHAFRAESAERGLPALTVQRCARCPLAGNEVGCYPWRQGRGGAQFWIGNEEAHFGREIMTRAQDDIAVTTDFTFTDHHTLNQDGK